MKRFLFLLLLTGMTTGWVSAQTDSSHATDSAAAQQDTMLAEDGEAGGISGADVDTPDEKQGIAWLPMLLGFAAGALVAGIIAGVVSGKKKAAPPMQATTETEVPATTTAGSRTQQDQKLKSQLNALMKEKESLQQQLESHRSFDNEYYGEAFRKLVAPMHEAMEKGSHREIEEMLMKIMSHYSSLTRYKIAKKQPYDEANIQYLISRKNPAEGLATEINRDTPVDKIPKHIKPLLDLLKEQASGGLDESIIAGYRIRNI